MSAHTLPPSITLSASGDIHCRLAMFKAVFEALDDGFIILDRELTIIHANSRATKVSHAAYGTTLSIGDRVLEQFPQHRRAALQGFFEKVLNGEPVSYELEVIQEEDSVWLRCRYVPLKEGQAVIGICALVGDVSAEKKLEGARARQAELEKKNEENRLLFQSFLNHSPLVGWITDEKGVKHFMNKRYQQTFGYRDEDLGRNLYDLFPEEEAERYQANNLKVIRERSCLQMTSKARTADDREIDLQIYIFPIDINGVTMAAGWGIDVTDQIRLQQELERSLERYLYVNEASSVAIYDCDLASNRCFRGKGFEYLFGFRNTETSLKDRLLHVHPDDHERYRLATTSSLCCTKTNKWTVEYRLLDAWGTYRHVVDRAYIIKEGGKAVRIIGALQDITELKNVESALKKSIEKYEYINRATSDALFEFDLEKQEVIKGKSYERMFGVMANRPLYENMHPDDVVRVKMEFAQYLEDPAVRRFQLEYRFRSSQTNYKNLVARCFVIRKSGKAVRVIGAVQDITEHRLLQQKLVEQEQSKKTEIMRTIIEAQEKERRKLSVDLHDNINQRLTYCKLMLESALQYSERSAELTAKTASTLQSTIEELRRLSYQLNPSALIDVGFREAVLDLVNNVQRKGSLKVDLSYEERRSTTLSEQDSVALYRILQEALSNISRHAEAGQASVVVKLWDHKALLSISDNGKGFSLSRTRKGAGINSMHNRVDYYQGSMAIHTSPGNGCQLTIEIALP